MLIDPGTLSRAEANALLTGLVAPRPIAWVSTISAVGSRNLAPFSFFNAFSFSPPVVGIGPGARDGVEKDSLANIRANGQFTVSVVTEELARRANLCGGDFPPEFDEWEIPGVTPAPSDDVDPPRVAESPAALECRVRQIIDLGTAEHPSNALVVGLVTRIHVDDDAIVDFVPQPDRLHLVGRMGEAYWCRTADRFELGRPTRSELPSIMGLAQETSPTEGLGCCDAEGRLPSQEE